MISKDVFYLYLLMEVDDVAFFFLNITILTQEHNGTCKREWKIKTKNWISKWLV